jgi:cell shape-determining protein MreD
MIRSLGLLIAAYALVVVETSLQTETGLVTPYGSFVWVLLPWLATQSSRSTSILAAAFYGLLIDSVSNHPPGLLIAATILATCILQRIVTQKYLETGPRVFVVSSGCACLMAMLVATFSIIAGVSVTSPIELLAGIATSSAFAALSATFVVTVFRVFQRMIIPAQSLAH